RARLDKNGRAFKLCFAAGEISDPHFQMPASFGRIAAKLESRFSSATNRGDQFVIQAARRTIGDEIPERAPEKFFFQQVRTAIAGSEKVPVVVDGDDLVGGIDRVNYGRKL